MSCFVPLQRRTQLERGMIESRTKAGREKARLDGVKFGRPVGKINRNSIFKAERIRIFLKAGKSYDWISKELSVSKKTISDIKKCLSSSSLYNA